MARANRKWYRENLGQLGIDVIKDDLSKRKMPSKDLSDIYWLEHINYDKSKYIIDRILSAMDFSNLKNTVRQKFSDLHLLYDELELFFSL